MKKIIISVLGLVLIICGAGVVKATDIMPYAGYWHTINVYVPANFANTSTAEATKWSSDAYARACITNTSPSYCYGLKMWIEGATGKNLTDKLTHMGNGGRCYEFLYHNVAEAKGNPVRLSFSLSVDQMSALDVYGEWSPDMAS